MEKQARVALVGAGVTRLGTLPDESGAMLACDAMLAAIEDAGLRRDDIGAVVYQPGVGVGAVGEAVRRLGLPADCFLELQSGGATAIASILVAAGILHQKQASYVISVIATKARSSRVLIGQSNEEQGHESVWGMFSPGARNAMRARHYLATYALDTDALAWPAIRQREHANKRPDAVFHDRPLTLEDHRASPWVAEPLRRDDYCLVNDGAAAFVITTADAAADLRKKPVVVMGAGMSHTARSATRGSSDYTSDLGTVSTAARETAFGQAGVSISDIDVAELYDPFSIYPLMHLEAYGWCGPGEASEFIKAGHASLGGTIPANTHGGHLAWGYLQGYGPLVEGARQLWGEGGATQVEGARLALVTGSGGTQAGSPAFANAVLGVR
ncbi:MAG: hypothetical protein GEU28_07920 [Dehalococcoidia bacterium]|nr:hypothetical protein [Dehalococcoidia bacterium]